MITANDLGNGNSAGPQTTTGQVSIGVVYVNPPPAVTISASVNGGAAQTLGNSPSNTLTINEGDSVLLVANTTIAEGETGTVTWTITQGNQPPTVSDGSMIHLNPGLPGTYQAIATVTDNFGSSAIATTGIQVLSVPPVLSNLAITPSVYENDPVTVSGMVSEPGAGETLNVTVNWGDGASSNEQLTASTTVQPQS